MTQAQAEKLKVGDRLHWNGDPGDEASGEVIDVGYAGFRVRWLDEPKTVSTFLFTDPNDRLANLTKL